MHLYRRSPLSSETRTTSVFLSLTLSSIQLYIRFGIPILNVAFDPWKHSSGTTL